LHLAQKIWEEELTLSDDPKENHRKSKRVFEALHKGFFDSTTTITCSNVQVGNGYNVQVGDGYNVHGALPSTETLRKRKLSSESPVKKFKVTNIIAGKKFSTQLQTSIQLKSLFGMFVQ